MSLSSSGGIQILPRSDDGLRLDGESLVERVHGIRLQIPNLRASMDTKVIGNVSLTSRRILFECDDVNDDEDYSSSRTPTRIQIGFKSVCMHAISSFDENNTAEKCVYFQVDGQCDPEIGFEKEEEEEEEDCVDDDYEHSTEVHFSPCEEKYPTTEERKDVVEKIFEAMNECALLNPDTEDDNDDEDDPFGGMITAETLGVGGSNDYFTSEEEIREAGLGEKLDEFERKLVISEEDRKRFEDAEED